VLVGVVWLVRLVVSLAGGRLFVHGFSSRARCLVAIGTPFPAPPPPSSAPSTSTRSTCAIAVVRDARRRCRGGFLLGLWRALGIAEQAEDTRLDSNERRTGSLLHRCRELRLHGDFGSAPDEGQQLLLHGPLGKLFVMERFALSFQDLKGRFQEGHGGTSLP